MSEFDLSAQMGAARSAVSQLAEKYVSAQEVLETVGADLAAAQQKLKRLERALAILNGEEPIAAAGAEKAQPAALPAVAPTSPPKPPKYEPPPPTGIAALACGACGEVGTYGEVLRPTRAGTLARLLVCSECENEQYLG